MSQIIFLVVIILTRSSNPSESELATRKTPRQTKKCGVCQNVIWNCLTACWPTFPEERRVRSEGGAAVTVRGTQLATGKHEQTVTVPVNRQSYQSIFTDISQMVILIVNDRDGAINSQ